MARNALVFTGILCVVLNMFAPLVGAARARLSGLPLYTDVNDDQQTIAPASFAEFDYDDVDEDYEAVYDDDEEVEGYSEGAGSLVATHSSVEGKCSLSSFNFGDRFSDIKLVGSGMRGCVYLAKDSKHGGMAVAIKVSKSRNIENECKKARNIHKNACGKKDLVKLAENYLPTCLESKGKYMVMHAVAGQGLGEKKTKITDDVQKLPTSTRASIFAQIIAALFAMHGSGWSHNDLHFQNILILEGTPKRVAIIDFGATQTIEKAGISWGGYHIDATLLNRVGAQLCSEGKLLTCLKQTWDADDEFLKALGMLMDNSKNNAMWPELMSRLYHTEFVQKHQPPLMRLFPSGQCG